MPCSGPENAKNLSHEGAQLATTGVTCRWATEVRVEAGQVVTKPASLRALGDAA
jgi:hypothetical protein